jgi:hypothetical protein
MNKKNSESGKITNNDTKYRRDGNGLSSKYFNNYATAHRQSSPRLSLYTE